MTPDAALKIGTRGSQLALWQARTVAALLEASGIVSQLVPIRTTGDRLQDAPLSEAGGKRLFVKEIEDALLRGTIDAAVHSAKDMPAEVPEGLEIAAALPREDPRDSLVLADGATEDGGLDGALARLGPAPVIGTSSIRRVAQLRVLMPGAVFSPIRGNVDTRLRKLDAGDYRALVLACAGLRRLGLASRISAPLPIDRCTPAPGQGIVAVEIRADDGRTRERLRAIHDRQAGMSLTAERALVTALGGGCQLPLGGLTLHDGDDLEMHAVVAAPDASRVIRCRVRGGVSDPHALGERAAEELVRGGAGPILDEARRALG